MQTISLPYVVCDDDARQIAEWQRLHACVVRTGYARAGTGDGTILPEKDLRDLLKSLFPNHPLGSWGIHCATREALRLRKQRPDGRIVFGGGNRLERRLKGLITNDEWRHRRHSRPIEIVGDRTRWGNRHLMLAPDGLSVTITFLKRSVTLRLPAMSGKTGYLVRAIARLADACEIGIGFSLGAKSISFTFDPMDLRRLPDGMTLEQVERAEREALGHKSRGRPRKNPDTHYAAHRVKPVPPAERPVHPEWRSAIPTLASRAVGIDLNPQWIGLTVIEIPVGADPKVSDAVRILDHRLIHLHVPIAAGLEALATHMARVARLAVSLARKWSTATIFHEDGLGKLRWSKKSRETRDLQTINFWSRNALIGGLGRRCALSGLTISPIWGGYSSTIGNMLFDLPDACAAAAEIARRGIAAARGEKDRLPVVPPRVHLRRWKDGEVPEASAAALADAGCWGEVHRTVKAAHLGVRRLHPPLAAAGSGLLNHDERGYAVRLAGDGKGGRIALVGPALPQAA